MNKSAVRLYVIVPRAGHSAVVFRRGPSKQVQLIRWDMYSDNFEPGQWLKGRIYERRADLSPSGDRLIYFAANYKKPYFSWTAISKPPYLTALALWPKGDGWGGGGLFDSENSVRLNHRPKEMELAEGFKLPKRFRIQPLWEHSGWGEDSPINDMRMERDGWIVLQQGKRVEKKGTISYAYDPPWIYAKRFSRQKKSFELHWLTLGYHERQGPWNVEEFLIKQPKGEDIELGRLDWADVDSNCDLLFAKEGCLYRLSPDNRSANPYDIKRAKKLCDFTASKFSPMAPSAEALLWD